MKLLLSLPASSASLLFIDTTQTPLRFQKFQISYKRQGKRERVTEFVKYYHPESSTMCPEPYLDIMLHDEEDDVQLHPDLKACGAVWDLIMTEMNDATE